MTLRVLRGAVGRAGRAAAPLEFGCLAVDGDQVYDFKLEGGIRFCF
jgi:hypothetical protein